MDDLTELKIIGIDPTRPPKLQRMPCIDLVFELSAQAPPAWCEEFNMLMGKQPYTTRIDPKTGKYIETWVRQPEEIPRALERMKKGVQEVTETQLAATRARAQAEADRLNVPGTQVSEAQLALDSIVAALDFDTPAP